MTLASSVEIASKIHNEFLQRINRVGQTNGERSTCIRCRNGGYSAVVRLNYFVANEKAEAKANVMLFGSCFQPQRIEKIGHYLLRYRWPLVVNLD